MDDTRRRTAAGLVAALGLTLMGCDSAQQQAADKERLKQRLAEAEAHADLKRIYDAYVTYYRKKQGPPAGIKELREAFGEEESEGLSALDSGKYRMQWGLAQENHLDDDDQTILAYERQAPAQGGLAVMLNGTVQHVTASQFATLTRKTDKGDGP